MTKDELIERLKLACSDCQSIMRRFDQPGGVSKDEIDKLLGVFNDAIDYIEGREGDGKA